MKLRLHMDEKRWQAREARRYRALTLPQRIAWFRDLERCRAALQNAWASYAQNDDLDIGARWRNPKESVRR